MQSFYGLPARLKEISGRPLKAIVHWIRDSSADEAVLTEINLNNLHRIYYAVLFVAVIHLTVMIALRMVIAEETGSGYVWAMGIIGSHFAGLVFISFIAVSLFVLKRQNRLTSGMINVILGVIIMWYLILGAMITSIDQMVTPSITPFLVICIGLATVFMVKPLYAALYYLIGYLCFFFMLSFTQQSPEVLLSSRINGAVIAGIGISIILLIWKSNVVNIRQRMMIEQQKQVLVDNNRQLEFFAAYDALTGLLTRRQFDLSVKHETDRMCRSQKTACIIIADIDHFKLINDHYGHPQGDLVLMEVAAVIKSHLRTSDIAARWGGEEFIILLPETDEEGGSVVAEKLRQAIQRHVFYAGANMINVTISMGVADLNPKESAPFLGGYEKADNALYLAKNRGRNRVELFDEWYDLANKGAQAH